MTWLAPRDGIGRGFALVVLLIWAQLAGGTIARAAGIPSKPATRVVDYANVTSPQFRANLDAQLEAFERSDSTQIIVALFQKLPEGEHLESFTHAVAEGWGVGQKGSNNGAVLFLFVQDRRSRIEVGYGLEPRLTDALCASILATMVPALRAGDYESAVRAGATSMIAAVRGEFKGTGRRPDRLKPGGLSLLAFILVVSALQLWALSLIHI